jgi:hypothetical protein
LEGVRSKVIYIEAYQCGCVCNHTGHTIIGARTPNELLKPVIVQVYVYVDLTPLTPNRNGSGQLFYHKSLLCGTSKKEEHHSTAHVLWQQQKTPQHLRPFTSISVTVSQYHVYLSNSTVTAQHRTGDAEQVLLPGTEKGRPAIPQ